MRPRDQARAVYQQEWCARTFEEDVEAHRQHGYIIDTPEGFAMARPVPKDAWAQEIVNPWRNWLRENCDAWLIYLMAGDLSVMRRWLPYELPWIGWERGNVLRWHSWESVKKRLQIPAESPLT